MSRFLDGDGEVHGRHLASLSGRQYAALYKEGSCLAGRLSAWCRTVEPMGFTMTSNDSD